MVDSPTESTGRGLWRARKEKGGGFVVKGGVRIGGGLKGGQRSEAEGFATVVGGR